MNDCHLVNVHPFTSLLLKGKSIRTKQYANNVPTFFIAVVCIYIRYVTETETHGFINKN